MRILNWVQSKLGGRNDCKRPEVKPVGTSQYHPPNRKEEFSDWPHGLLAIGTFGNGDLKCESQANILPEKPQELSDMTVEQVKKLQKELKKLLSLKPQSESCGSESEEKNLPLDKFLNCPSSLSVDRKNRRDLQGDLENEEGEDLSPNAKMVLTRAKDSLAENKNSIKQRSFSFLLKKMIACRGGFPPMPSLQDPISESRMEKLMRALLHKKIYPHGSPPAAAKRSLEKKPANERDDEEKVQRNEESGSKWVKTDSEYIVLEI